MSRSFSSTASQVVVRFPLSVFAFLLIFCRAIFASASKKKFFSNLSGFLSLGEAYPRGYRGHRATHSAETQGHRQRYNGRLPGPQQTHGEGEAQGSQRLDKMEKLGK